MSFDFTPYHDDFLFIPLGGSNEIGMNLNLYRYRGKFLMVDLGIGFANEYLPGVDVLVPDISFLEAHRDDLLGLVLTHAHEDHLGGVPYLWDDLRCPIYATPFTSAMLKNKLAFDKVPRGIAVHEVKPGSKTTLGPFDIEMIELTHSIPEMQALAIKTPAGTVLHTGDWKFDPNPMVGSSSNEQLLSKHGEAGVMAIVCDSTNVFVKGSSGSEGDVRREMMRVIRDAGSHRVLVTTFASNLARLESIIMAGAAAGRKVVVSGKSIWRVIAAAQESGYLKDLPELIDEKDAMSIPRSECMIVATGSQGEPMASLPKMSRGEHQFIRLSPQDTVIFSSRIIPGNESRIGYMHNLLVEQGVEVMTGVADDIHVSGHPARDELTKMYEMVRPKIAVPVHGEPRHLHEHAKLAKSLGVPEAVEGSNGSVILLKEGQAGVVGIVPSGYMAVDGSTLLPADSDLFRERRRLRDNGCLIATLVMEDAGLAETPRIYAPGCLDDDADADVIEEMVDAIERSVDGAKRHSEKTLEEAARRAIGKIVKRELGKRPLIRIQIIQR